MMLCESRSWTTIAGATVAALSEREIEDRAAFAELNLDPAFAVEVSQAASGTNYTCSPNSDPAVLLVRRTAPKGKKDRPCGCADELIADIRKAKWAIAAVGVSTAWPLVVRGSGEKRGISRNVKI